MIKTKLNPLITTVLSLVIWFLGAYVTMISIRGQTAFGIMLGSFYFAPIVSFIVYNTMLILNDRWWRQNKILTVLVELLIIGWAIKIFLYWRSLFI